MNRTFAPPGRLAVWIASALALGCPGPAPIADGTGGAPDRVAALLSEAVDGGRIGSAVGLVALDDRVVFLEAFGEFDPGVPMQTDAIVRLASSAKTLTAAATLILVQEGKIRLDDPLSRFIPAYETVRVRIEGSDQTVAPTRPITMEHLLTHTAGLDVASEAFEALWDEAMAEDSISTVEFAERLAAEPLVSQPGERFDYGYYGSTYEVLAAVIEVAAGQRLDIFTTKSIFEPLGMTDSYFIVPEHKHHRLAARYGFDSAGALEIATHAGIESPPGGRFISGGGQVRTTIGDFYRFARCLLNGGELDGVRILDDEMVRRMMSPMVDASTFGSSSGDYGWGYGGSVRARVKPGDLGSVGTYTWNGGTGTYYWIDPERRLIGILFTPVRPPSPWELLLEFEEAVYRALGGELAELAVE